MFVVAVTRRGSLSVYARVPVFASAAKLRSAARDRGYSDARVMDEADFFEETRAEQRSEASPGRAA